MKNVRLALLLLTIIAIGACKKTVKSPSGYEVNFIKKNGGATPKMGEFVYFDYYVKKDSQLFFSSNQRGQQMKFQVVDTKKFGPQEKPIVEALMLMSKGDSAFVVQKIDTMKVKPQGFNGTKLLTITVVLKDIVSEEKFMADLAPRERDQYKLQKSVDTYMATLESDTANVRKRQPAVRDSTNALAADFLAGKLNANLKTAPKGLKYLILRPGTGPTPQHGQLTAVHYYGATSDGRHFDDSYDKGAPIVFPLGEKQVIEGWDEGLALLNEGTTAVLFIPSELGYGKTGQPGSPIRPNENLVFYVELKKVMGEPTPILPESPVKVGPGGANRRQPTEAEIQAMMQQAQGAQGGAKGQQPTEAQIKAMMEQAKASQHK